MDERYKSRKFDDIKHAVRRIEGLAEILILSVIYYFIWRFQYSYLGFYTYYGNGKFVLIGIYAILVWIIFLNFDGFQYGHIKLSEVVVSQWIAILIVNIITYFQLCLMANKMLTIVPMLLILGIDIAVIFILVYLYTYIYHRCYAPRRMIMIYGSEEAIALKIKMDSRTDKYNITKIIGTDEPYSDICNEIKNYDAVVISDVDVTTRNRILKFCYENKIRVYFTPNVSDIMIKNSGDITLFDTPLYLVSGHGLLWEQRIIKRIFDILFSFILMIPTLPIMGIVALAIKLEDGGPVFYKQERITINERKFNILKFRSMITNAEKDGKSTPAIDNDPRITKVGKVIRATRIDELPQVLNIFAGAMSFVGPRPERTQHYEEFKEELPEFRYRTKVKGGLTGFAQIYGKYNTSAYDKLRLDLMYIENYSIMLDIKLILMTIRIMFKPESTEGFDKVIDYESIKAEIAATKEKNEDDR